MISASDCLLTAVSICFVVLLDHRNDCCQIMVHGSVTDSRSKGNIVSVRMSAETYRVVLVSRACPLLENEGEFT